MSKDDENVLACLGTSDRVDERFLNVSVIHVQVATEDPPKHAFEGWEARTLNGAGNKPSTTVQ